MKLIFMHRTNARWEAGAVPTPELVANVGAMLGEAARSGALVAADGLRASSQGARVVFAGGRRKIIEGPLAGGNELIASARVLRVRSLAEAIEQTSRFAAALGDGEVDIRPATEPWDIGIGAKPNDLTTRRYIAMWKADRRSEAGAPLSAEQAAALAALTAELERAGVLLLTLALQPSSQAVRVARRDGRLTSIDGPFAETKELVGGFVILDLPDLQAAVDWAHRYIDVLGDTELDIVPLA